LTEFPEVFRIDSDPHYKSDAEAAKDACIGWRLCQNGRNLPDYFMDRICRHIGEEVTQDNCERLWIKYRIKEDRAARGLSQVAYARLLGVGEATVAAWENGRKKPNYSIWFLITFSTEALQIAGRKVRRNHTI